VASESAPKSLGTGNTEHESSEREGGGAPCDGAILRREQRTTFMASTESHPRRHALTRGHLPTFTNHSGTGRQRAWLLNDLGAPLRI
jgi:hypothetical protein